MFNPHPRMEGDLHPYSLPKYPKSFNPRPHMESDNFYRFTHSSLLCQSTPSHGERLVSSCTMSMSIQFQSTPSHGGRRR